MGLTSYPLSLLWIIYLSRHWEKYKERINSAFEGSSIRSDMKLLIRGVTQIVHCGLDSINEASLLLIHPIGTPLSTTMPLS